MRNSRLSLVVSTVQGRHTVAIDASGGKTGVGALLWSKVESKDNCLTTMNSNIRASTVRWSTVLDTGGSLRTGHVITGTTWLLENGRNNWFPERHCVTKSVVIEM